MSDEKITCVICYTPVPVSEISQYAAYGGLPSPCCEICFSVNDYTIKTQQQLIERSYKKRVEMMEAKELGETTNE